MEDTKKCPYCAEEIKKEAVFCKHCKMSLDGSSNNDNIKNDLTKEFDSTLTEVLLIGIPILGIILNIFWVGNMNLLENPENSLFMINTLVVLITAFVAYYEAEKLKMTNKDKGNQTPREWFIILLIFWVIGYPAYLYKRKNYRAKNKLLVGFIVMLIFVITTIAMVTLIKDKKDEVRDKVNSFQKEYYRNY